MYTTISLNKSPGVYSLSFQNLSGVKSIPVTIQGPALKSTAIIIVSLGSIQRHEFFRPLFETGFYCKQAVIQGNAIFEWGTSNVHVIGLTCHYDVIGFVFVAKRRANPTPYYDVNHPGDNLTSHYDVIMTSRTYPLYVSVRTPGAVELQFTALFTVPVVSGGSVE